jgi:hypothetical protein
MVNAFNPTPKNKMSFDLSPDAIARMTAPQPQKVVFTARGVNPEMRKRAQEIKRKNPVDPTDDNSRHSKYRQDKKIWEETGLWEYQPNVWVQEIPDNKSYLDFTLPPIDRDRLERNAQLLDVPNWSALAGRTIAQGNVPDVLKRGANDKLYSLYPELNKTPMEVYNHYMIIDSEGVLGFVNPYTGGLHVGADRQKPDKEWVSDGEGDYISSSVYKPASRVKKELTGTAIHELQHAISIMDMMRMSKDDTRYHFRGEEALARLAQARKNLTAEERRKIAPMYHVPLGVPRNDRDMQYSEDVDPRYQEPERLNQKSVESSPVFTDIYGIKPKRSVKPIDPSPPRGAEVKNTLLRLVRKEDKKEPSPRKRK